jgi:hypothetical protein
MFMQTKRPSFILFYEIACSEFHSGKSVRAWSSSAIPENEPRVWSPLLSVLD